MSVPSWATVGERVVCVADSSTACIHPGPAVYTITKAGYFGCSNWHIVVGGCVERADRFRPLITQSDDISAHFQHHLSNPVREEV